MARLATLLLLALLLTPTWVRRWPEAPARSCRVEGRGTAPRHWLGCAADPGAQRGLTGEEQLVSGLPVDVNRASVRELAFVPGLSRALAEEVRAERERGGAFGALDDLLRVRGIGPRRLERARPFLTAAPERVAVANGGQ